VPTYPLLEGEVAEIRLNATLFGQTIINTFHYRIGSGVPGSGDWDSLLGAFDVQMWSDALSSVLSEDFESVFLAGQTVYPVRKVATEVALTPSAGEVVAPACPPTTAVVIKKLTVLAGSANRGRVFIAGIPYQNIAGGSIAAGSYGAWQTISAGIAEPLTFGASRFAVPVVYSTASGVIRGDVTDFGVDQILRVQRRREVGRGI